MQIKNKTHKPKIKSNRGEWNVFAVFFPFFLSFNVNENLEQMKYRNECIFTVLVIYWLNWLILGTISFVLFECRENKIYCKKNSIIWNFCSTGDPFFLSLFIYILNKLNAMVNEIDVRYYFRRWLLFFVVFNRKTEKMIGLPL